MLVPRRASRRRGQNSSGGDGILEAIERARIAADACADKQADDVVLLDIHRVSPVTDYFVICSAETRRQLKAIYDAVDEEMSKAGVHLLQREGTVESGWILLDFGDVIVHIFDADQRAYYQLERLWSDGTPVLHVQ